MSQPNPSQVIESLRNYKEAEAAAVRRGTGKTMEMAVIALKAVYEAASNGNVRCQVAVREIETLSSLHDRKHPQDRRVLRPTSEV